MERDGGQILGIKARSDRAIFSEIQGRRVPVEKVRVKKMVRTEASLKQSLQF